MPIIAVAGVLAALLLGLVRRAPYAGEDAVTNALADVVGRDPEVLRLMVLPSEPVVVVPVIAAMVVVLGAQRRWSAAGLCVLAPAVAVAVNTWLLKPLFGVISDGGLAYPSGHTVSLVAVCTLLALLARPGVARAVSAAVGVVLTAGAGVGMVVIGFHQPLDVVGGVLFGIAAVLLLREVTTRTLARPRPEPAR